MRCADAFTDTRDDCDDMPPRRRRRDIARGDAARLRVPFRRRCLIMPLMPPPVLIAALSANRHGADA